MSNLRASVRPAVPADAPLLAEFVNMAGEGMPLYLWTKMAAPGEDPWDIGRSRAVRDSGGFSYRNAFMLERNRQAVACLIGYPVPDQPEAINYETMPPMFVPLQELENLAPGTWYVNVLATLPAERGNGFGGELLSVADRLASQSGCVGTSIIVSDANAGARRLYTRNGYREIAPRPKVKEDWAGAGQTWVLLVKATT